MKKKEKKVSKKQKTTKVKTSTKDKRKKKNSFILGVKQELKKVTWPDKKDVIKYSVATLVFCIIVMLFFLMLDLGLSVIKGVFN